jgi:hypothetical protein
MNHVSTGKNKPKRIIFPPRRGDAEKERILMIEGILILKTLRLCASAGE